jgi:methionyl-tRNA formyltransferase
MRITLLCSDPTHPVNNHLKSWIETNKQAHTISLVRSKMDLSGGDMLFLVSCAEIISAKEREKYTTTLVLHASDLPRGRGWSPHIWQIISGAEKITLSLLEAEDAVDSGRIWLQSTFFVPKHALWHEINELLFDSEVVLMDLAVKNFKSLIPINQNKEITPTYFSRRKPVDSKLDADCSIASQFNRMRVCDPQRFPAYFELYGHRYKITLEKINEVSGCN